MCKIGTDPKLVYVSTSIFHLHKVWGSGSSIAEESWCWNSLSSDAGYARGSFVCTSCSVAKRTSSKITPCPLVCGGYKKLGLRLSEHVFSLLTLRPALPTLRLAGSSHADVLGQENIRDNGSIHTALVSCCICSKLLHVAQRVRGPSWWEGSRVLPFGDTGGGTVGHPQSRPGLCQRLGRGFTGWSTFISRYVE